MSKYVRSPDDWIIIKNGAFYRPGAAGYTNNILYAGAYTEEEAKRYCGGEWSKDDRPNAFPASKFLQPLEQRFLDMRNALIEVRDACLFEEDFGQVGFTEDVVIPTELFQEITRLLRDD